MFNRVGRRWKQWVEDKPLMIALILIILFVICIICYSILTDKIILVQTVINGLIMGGVYGMIAMGLSLIFGVMKIINIWHGELVVLGAYITYWLYTRFGINPFLSLIMTSLTLLGIGIPVGMFIMNPARKAGIDQPLIVTFGASIALFSLMRSLWTATPRGILIKYGTLTLPGGIPISILRLIIIVVAMLGLALTHLFLMKTYTGKAIRAVAMDRSIASLMGINVDRINALAYGIGLALAGIAGSLISLMLSFDPASGPLFTNKGFCVIVLGGVGYIPGTFVGGVILGLAESIGAFILGDAVRDGIAYMIFLLVLLFKPTGLFAKYRAF
ncbi:MAG: branched-chain amino acid ABC transporter permease [Candidatus Hodarchaeota archaeon]